MNDARARLRYLDETLDLLFPAPATRARTPCSRTACSPAGWSPARGGTPAGGSPCPRAGTASRAT
ncbi:hypothetical protein [Streptosporangium vulgare]|uniref:hypothetical protein n=1 Tax=Streptosporangium vulgare TaxID=46190 RepID=UPI0031D47AC7